MQYETGNIFKELTCRATKRNSKVAYCTNCLDTLYTWIIIYVVHTSKEGEAETHDSADITIHNHFVITAIIPDSY